MLLVARRSAPAKLAGLWEFPGGKVEPGEKPEAALERELAEELGVGVRLGVEVPGESLSGWPLTANANMRVWTAEIVRGEPLPLEDHDELRWMSLRDQDALLGMAWIPADLPIVRALVQALAAPAERARS